jgi:hypothetical protein
MKKRERRGGRQAVENWHGLALELDGDLKTARRGERDGVYRDFADKLGVSVSVPRRMIQALRFLDYVRDDVGFPELAKRIAEVAAQPLMSLVLLDRWSQYSPDRALSAAQRLVDGELNLPMLRELERADRATGERVRSATDDTWQGFAATCAVRQIEDMQPGSRCIWAARGWRPDAFQQTSLKLPGVLNDLPALPGIQLVVERDDADEPLLVSILSDRVPRTRSPAAIVQVVLQLLGYARLGCTGLLLAREPEEVTAIEELIAKLGHPAELSVTTLEFD